MKIPVNELRKFNGTYEWYEKYGEGYRIVYFYDDGSYYVGGFARDIDGFMFDFCESYPIDDESDIPEFISVDDLLGRYLNSLKDISAAALYKTDGTCVMKKTREVNKSQK